ncbi:MAG: class I SAM-dependent methyltransferase [Desulfocapsaceae bacterium]|nr:class I SAM-dependent methyltransferase [Desulfocapsaceae bacterium]
MANKRICPVERAGSLDSRLRRLVQNPHTILQPFVQEAMTVIDLGCGPGFCTLDMASLVGPLGRVIACDVQTGMLDKLQAKIQGTDLEERIILHKCDNRNIGIDEKVDFILAFYVVHELADQQSFFKEVMAILKIQGALLIIEPPLHVSRKDFDETISIGQQAGLLVEEGPRVFLSKTILMKKAGKQQDNMKTT